MGGERVTEWFVKMTAGADYHSPTIVHRLHRLRIVRDLQDRHDGAEGLLLERASVSTRKQKATSQKEA